MSWPFGSSIPPLQGKMFVFIVGALVLACGHAPDRRSCHGDACALRIGGALWEPPVRASFVAEVADSPRLLAALPAQHCPRTRSHRWSDTPDCNPGRTSGIGLETCEENTTRERRWRLDIMDRGGRLVDPGACFACNIEQGGDKERGRREGEEDEMQPNHRPGRRFRIPGPTRGEEEDVAPALHPDDGVVAGGRREANIGTVERPAQEDQFGTHSICGSGLDAKHSELRSFVPGSSRQMDASPRNFLDQQTSSIEFS